MISKVLNLLKKVKPTVHSFDWKNTNRPSFRLGKTITGTASYGDKSDGLEPLAGFPTKD